MFGLAVFNIKNFIHTFSVWTFFIRTYFFMTFLKAPFLSNNLITRPSKQLITKLKFLTNSGKIGPNKQDDASISLTTDVIKKCSEIIKKMF